MEDPIIMRTNTTKAKLAEGKVVFGAIISRHAPDLVELFGATPGAVHAPFGMEADRTRRIGPGPPGRAGRPCVPLVPLSEVRPSALRTAFPVAAQEVLDLSHQLFRVEFFAR